MKAASAYPGSSVAEHNLAVVLGDAGRASEAHYEFAQLIWMTTADSAAAIAPLDAMFSSYPDTVDLYSTKARVMMYTAGAEESYHFVA